MQAFRSDCPCCSARDTRLFHRIENVPVNSVLNIRSRPAAQRFPVGEVALACCRHCGFIYNGLFDKGKVRYSSDCEESQGYSPTFNAFAQKLAGDLIEKYRIYGKRIVEIGCGKGEFLKLMCRIGNNSGIGFDPAFVPGRGDENEQPSRVEFIKDYYRENYSDCRGDIICCRMTLEHIPETAELVQMVRRSIGPGSDTIVVFQVPDVTRILRDCAFEDIYYEHCSYFSPGSLARLFRSACFDILNLQVVYGEQYILIEAKPSNEKTSPQLDLESNLDRLDELVRRFSSGYPKAVRYWEALLHKMDQKNERVVIWGSGSKGATFLTTVKTSTSIQYVVDINPHRQGTFMPCTAQQIVSPEFLKSYRPAAVIVMNSIYSDEIKNQLSALGLTPEIYVLGPIPSVSDERISE